MTVRLVSVSVVDDVSVNALPSYPWRDDRTWTFCEILINKYHIITHGRLVPILSDTCNKEVSCCRCGHYHRSRHCMVLEVVAWSNSQKSPVVNYVKRRA